MFSTLLEQQGQFPLTTSKVNTGVRLACDYSEYPPGGEHLANQVYTVCIRQEQSHCAISYTEAGPGAWGLGGQSPAPTSLTPGAYLGDSCQEDWVGIPGAGDTAGAATNYDRFCGDRLNFDASSPSPATVYTLVTPFRSLSCAGIVASIRCLQINGKLWRHWAGQPANS